MRLELRRDPGDIIVGRPIALHVYAVRDDKPDRDNEYMGAEIAVTYPLDKLTPLPKSQLVTFPPGAAPVVPMIPRVSTAYGLNEPGEVPGTLADDGDLFFCCIFVLGGHRGNPLFTATPEGRHVCSFHFTPDKQGSCTVTLRRRDAPGKGLVDKTDFWSSLTNYACDIGPDDITITFNVLGVGNIDPLDFNKDGTMDIDDVWADMAAFGSDDSNFGNNGQYKFIQLLQRTQQRLAQLVGLFALFFLSSYALAQDCPCVCNANGGGGSATAFVSEVDGIIPVQDVDPIVPGTRIRPRFSGFNSPTIPGVTFCPISLLLYDWTTPDGISNTFFETVCLEEGQSEFHPDDISSDASTTYTVREEDAPIASILWRTTFQTCDDEGGYAEGTFCFFVETPDTAFGDLNIDGTVNADDITFFIQWYGTAQNLDIDNLIDTIIHWTPTP